MAHASTAIVATPMAMRIRAIEKLQPSLNTRHEVYWHSSHSLSTTALTAGQSIMSAQSNILEELSTSVIEGNSEAARRAATEALNAQLDPVEAIEKGLAKGLREVGRRFEAGEMFLMQLILSGEAMKTGVEILKPEMLRQKKQLAAAGKFLIGTVEGDIHDIGKSIVAAMLTAEGFDVVDMGVDIPDKVFVEKTKELQPNILGLSALMTTTRTKQMNVIEALKRAGTRNAVKVMVGGATVTPEWAQQIGADGYGEDAIDATKKARELLKSGKS